MKKLVLPIILTACTASLAFASVNLSQQTISSTTDDVSVQLSDDKALAIKKIMDQNQAQKREIMRQAREQMASLQKEKIEKLSQILDRKDLKHIDILEASWREEFRGQRKHQLSTQ